MPLQEQSAENKHLDQTAEDDAIFFVATTSSKANDENDAQRENASTSACQMREVRLFGHMNYGSGLISR
jgi:hypothetical protein